MTFCSSGQVGACFHSIKESHAPGDFSLTHLLRLRNNAFVRKAPVFGAALLAVFFLFLLPGQLSARTAHRARTRHGSHALKKPSKTHRLARSVSRRGQNSHSRHSTNTPSAVSRKTLIHQNTSGEAVLVQPPVFYNYPPGPCEPQDVVLEAHVHESVEGETAEVQEAEAGPDVNPLRSGEGLARIARRLGSLFRPKSSAAQVQPGDVDLTDLISQEFLIPVEGVNAGTLSDSFLATRGRHAKHLAIDIAAPRGTPVLATTDGKVVRISREGRGGKTIYQKDSTGQYLLFYCHLARYADGLEQGTRVKKGEVIGYVGSTGHVVGGAHLHFSITRLPGDDDNFRKGLAINPYLLFLAGVP